MISSLSSISTYTSNSGYSLMNSYRPLATGRRINSAADDAAGLAISEGLKTQVTSNTQAVQNARDTQAQYNISESDLGTLTSSLQRMRTLSVQASGVYSSVGLSSIQAEIDQIKGSIGGGRLQSMGLEDYDVTSGNFDLTDIDKAISSVVQSRGGLGAQSNALDHEMSYTANASENLTAAESRIGDTDYNDRLARLSTE